MSNEFTVNSDKSFIEAQAIMLENYKKHGFTKYRFTHPKTATLPMNALLHAWLTEFAAHLANCLPSDVTEGMLDGIKRTMKKLCYQESGEGFLVYKIECPLTGNKRLDLTSSAKWSKAEKHYFLNWVQGFAAEKGLILESKGEYKEMKAEGLGVQVE